ncbi:MAG: PhoD-like phosphatase N-terminal domain-containing protein, partial [Thermomicrobiales bacterium]
MDRAQFEHLLIRRANRRRFLAGGLGLAGLLAAVSLPGRPTRAAWIPGTQATPEAAPATNPTFTRDPFSLGVASGDPLPDSVVLWTRLAPDPLNGGGVDPVAIDVRWELARDEGMTEIVQSGTTTAVPELAHSIHIDANGLEPATEYYYRFMAGDAG